MTNLQKYNYVFKKLFHVEDNELEALTYKETAEWNSMAHIALVAEIEEQFNLDFDTEDIFHFQSYIIGKGLLTQKFGIYF